MALNFKSQITAPAAHYLHRTQIKYGFYYGESSTGSNWLIATLYSWSPTPTYYRPVDESDSNGESRYVGNALAKAFFKEAYIAESIFGPGTGDPNGCEHGDAFLQEANNNYGSVPKVLACIIGHLLEDDTGVLYSNALDGSTDYEVSLNFYNTEQSIDDNSRIVWRQLVKHLGDDSYFYIYTDDYQQINDSYDNYAGDAVWLMAEQLYYTDWVFNPVNGELISSSLYPDQYE